MTRYSTDTIGKVVSLRCRRSLNNREVIVLDNSKIDQVYLYDQATIDDVLSYLRDTLNIDIKETVQSPITFKLVNHLATGEIYQISHEEDETRDDFHAFFTPRQDEDE